MEIRVKVPENLNISELLRASNIKPKDSLVDKVAFFCYEIHLAAVYHRDYLDDRDRPFFPLSAVILQKYIHDYKEIETLLIKSGVIESDGIYHKGQKSIGFRFAEAYYGQKFKEHAIKSVSLYKKIKNFLTHDTIDDSAPEIKPYSFLLKVWRSGGLRMDVEAAMKWIDATYQTEINRLSYCYDQKVKSKQLTRSKADKEKKAAIKKITEKSEIWKTSVLNFSSGRLVFQVDDFSKRLHTKLSNLKKELRGFITYNGDSLVSLDIKNSQPYLSLVLFNEDFWRIRTKTGRKILTYRKLGVDKIEEGRIIKLLYTIKLAKSSENQAGQGFEFEHFANLVTSGTLYEFLMELFKEIRTNRFSRAEVKRQFLIFLYYNPADLKDRFIEDYPVINLLNQVFPKISELFRLLKQDQFKFAFHPLKPNERYKFPPQLLQRIESHLVIEKVCKELKKDNKNIPLFTIHDSIVTTKEYAQIALDKMEQVLTDAIGYIPTISSEDLTPLPANIETEFKAREITELTDEMIELLSYW